MQFLVSFIDLLRLFFSLGDYFEAAVGADMAGRAGHPQSPMHVHRRSNQFYRRTRIWRSVTGLFAIHTQAGEAVGLGTRASLEAWNVDAACYRNT